MNAYKIYARAKHGFTIVELLVVIVVIGILASVATVAYKGIQARAENIRTSAAASQYIELFELYQIKYGHYPGTVIVDGLIQDQFHGCIGEASDFPAEGVLADDQCYYGFMGVNNISKGTTSSEVTADIRKMTAELPTASYPTITYKYGNPANPTVKWALRGFAYMVTHSGQQYRISWALKGKQECIPIGNDYGTSYDAENDVTLCTKAKRSTDY